MIAIIAEKPSVAQEIARVVGAEEKRGGWLQGRGYIVTWAFGHLLTLAPPESYGKKRGSELPIIPEKFKLEKRDKSAARQLGVIRRALEQCESVVCATDAGCEGELIFCLIVEYLGCKLPVKRLWISSLTDEAIEKGLRDMRDGSEYNRLFMAAECRAKADWLVGMNASRALAMTTGDANCSLGRVQTPTLAMIAARYLEHRNFLSSDYWSLSVMLANGGAVRRFHCAEDFKTEPTAIRLPREATVTRVECKTIHEQPPLLYDLTELQKDCNTRHEMSAERTLEAAQSLYEKRLISYPRTVSRHISPDTAPQMPSLLRMILRMEQFAHLAEVIDPSRTSRRSIDASKVTDHHALIITGNYVREPLTTNEQHVYDTICGRMLESFAPRCEKETLSVDATIGEMSFRSSSTKILSAGWRAVYNLADELDNDGAHDMDFVEGDSLQTMGHSISARKTRPRPIYTEATLLAAMEDNALGTPATRATTIEALLRRGYIERFGRSLIPTARGLALHESVQNLRIADVELTATWEKSLTAIESGEMKPETFMKAICIYAKQVTAEVLSLNIARQPEDQIPCPKCAGGRITIHHRLAKCDGCGLIIYRRFLNKTLSDQQLRALLTHGRTKPIKGFHGKANKTFAAALRFDANEI